MASKEIPPQILEQMKKNLAIPDGDMEEKVFKPGQMEKKINPAFGTIFEFATGQMRCEPGKVAATKTKKAVENLFVLYQKRDPTEAEIYIHITEVGGGGAIIEENGKTTKKRKISQKREKYLTKKFLP